jgi:two-component system, sensor histidine kinase and response regulator
MSRTRPDEYLPEQVVLMCRLLYFPATATVPAAIVVTLVMGPTVGVAPRVAWVLALAVLAVVRVLAGRTYLSRPRSPVEAQRWVWRLLALAALVGGVWSLGGTLLLPVGQPVREALVAMSLIAALAAGSSALSTIDGGYAAFAIPFVLPMAAWQIATGFWPRQVLGVVYLIFLLVMIGAAVRTARNTREQFRLARENAELIVRLRAERDALDAANAELRLASDAKSRFLGHMSHELRTPLTVILGYSDLLLRDESERRRAEALERIKGAGGALLAIVNDLLEVASIDASKAPLHESDFAPAELLDEVVAALRSHPEARDLEIGSALGEELPARLRADRGRLRQVLLNLGINALRRTTRGRVLFAQRLVAGGGPVPWLRVEVADSGAGVAREAQARLFEPFAQLDDAIRRESGDAGLGLAISRSIVERLGGRIGVDSEPGAGTTFWFEVPVHGAEPAPPPAVRFGRRVPEAFAGAVLIAEDVAETREFLARFLRETGCAPVVEVANGRELLAATRDAHFDLMLVDWRMPELDGLAAIAELRATERTTGRPRTPAVVVTAGLQQDDRARCLAAGADAVVEKPVDLDRLAAVLRPWLRTPADGAAATAPASGARRAVLVADDHPGNRQLLKEMLEEEGFARVEAVGSGLEAVAAWEQGIYDVLLLDWQMPGLDGLGALRRIRALERELGRPRTAVVIVTGRLSDSERRVCVDAGADGCVAKPYSPEELLGAAERALQSVGR